MMIAFSAVFADVTKQGTKLQTSEYLPSGKYPIIDQGQDDIAGYTDREDGLFTDVPAIIFGDHTRIVKYVDMPFFLGADGVKVLKATIPDVDYRYLYYAVSAVKIPNTGYNRHFKWLKEAQISLPDLSTQRRIADTLDKVSEGIGLCGRMMDELDLMVKAKFGEMFGDPVSNPMGWEEKKLGHVCKKLTDGTHFSPESFATGAYKYVTAKNIRINGFDFSNITYIPEEVHRPIYERCNPEYGDVLYIKDGVTTGIAMVNTLHEEFSLLSSVALLKQDGNVINGCFLCGILNNAEMYLNIRMNMGGAAITRLTIAKLNEIRVIVPPIELQEQFATFVSQTDKSRLTIQQVLSKMEMVKLALMQEYFK